jgi:hypothetical protein
MLILAYSVEKLLVMYYYLNNKIENIETKTKKENGKITIYHLSKQLPFHGLEYDGFFYK